MKTKNFRYSVFSKKTGKKVKTINMKIPASWKGTPKSHGLKRKVFFNI